MITPEQQLISFGALWVFGGCVACVLEGLACTGWRRTLFVGLGVMLWLVLVVLALAWR